MRDELAWCRRIILWNKSSESTRCCVLTVPCWDTQHGPFVYSRHLLHCSQSVAIRSAHTPRERERRTDRPFVRGDRTTRPFIVSAFKWQHVHKYTCIIPLCIARFVVYYCILCKWSFPQHFRRNGAFIDSTLFITSPNHNGSNWFVVSNVHYVIDDILFVVFFSHYYFHSLLIGVSP